MTHKIFELYSGIGGMHCAWNESGLPGEVVAAIDINTVANEVYRCNFPETHLITRNIQSLSPLEINQLNNDTILMSPPCQPFSRNGKYLDDNDRRSNSFLYIISILNELTNVKYILMENVKGFENSIVRNLFIEKLTECDFEYQEFLLSPIAVGVPNSRLRYYCIAQKKGTVKWNFVKSPEIIEHLPGNFGEPFAVDSILQEDVSETYLVPDKHLRRAYIFDIRHRNSTRTCCFTKAYTHYVEGTGSVFTEENPEIVEKCLEEAKCFEPGSEEFLQIIRKLKLRFFTPKELLSLMSFPDKYVFPSTITNRQCYRLIGNSVNVKVISELIKLLFGK